MVRSPLALQGKSKHTEVLDVLVGEVADSAGRLSTGLLASAPCLVNHDAVCESGGEEGGAVAELGHLAIVVHAKPREDVAGDAKEKGGMSVRIDVSSAYIPSSQERENRLFRCFAPGRYRLAAPCELRFILIEDGRHERGAGQQGNRGS